MIRERRLWLAALCWTLLIYSTLSAVRAPIEFLRAHGLLRISVAAVFLLTAATIAFFLYRNKPNRREILLLSLFGLVYFIAFSWLERSEERLHLIEYGVLAGLVYAALLERRRRLFGAPAETVPEMIGPAAGAVLIASAAGWGDELIQEVLPTRVYDFRDVVLNVISAFLAVTAMVARQRTRSRQG